MSIVSAIGDLPILSAGSKMVRRKPCAKLSNCAGNVPDIKFPQHRPSWNDHLLMLLLVVTIGMLMASPAGAATRCRAIDGDTLQCGRDRVRLQSVYAAERDEPGGNSARRNLQQRIDAGDVRISKRGRDRYGRVVADVYVNGRRIEQADVGPVGGRGTPRGSADGTRAPVRSARLHTTGPRTPKAAKQPGTPRQHAPRAHSRKNKKH